MVLTDEDKQKLLIKFLQDNLKESGLDVPRDEVMGFVLMVFESMITYLVQVVTEAEVTQLNELLEKEDYQGFLDMIEFLRLSNPVAPIAVQRGIDMGIVVAKDKFKIR